MIVDLVTLVGLLLLVACNSCFVLLCRFTDSGRFDCGFAF